MIELEWLPVWAAALGAGAAAVRHIWAKTKCLYLMKQRLDAVEEGSERDRQTHREIFDRLNSLDKNVAAISGMLKGRRI